MNVFVEISVVDGQTVSFKNFRYIVSGDMITQFQEAYKVNLESESLSGQFAPHPVKFNYQSGQYQPISLTIPLFSGRDSARGILDTGAQIKREATALAALARPEFKQNTFLVPPLCRLTYGRFWSAKGFFTESVVSPQGAFDREGLPLMVNVTLVFERHLAGRFQRAVAPGGLLQATSNGYNMFG